MNQEPERLLGVVEALTAVRDQCPHAAVRENAARALESVQREGAPELLRQASLVLSTVSGWRGERARQVKRSLTAFLEAQQAGAEGGREERKNS